MDQSQRRTGQGSGRTRRRWPKPNQGYQLKRGIAGLGVWGIRILALSCSGGAFVAREAKAIRPSAWVWHEKSVFKVTLEDWE